jgi:hypothetical protein
MAEMVKERPRRMLVVAGTYVQFKGWRAEREERQQAVYVSSELILRGRIAADNDLCFVGTWLSRSDLAAVLDGLRICGYTEEAIVSAERNSEP